MQVPSGRHHLVPVEQQWFLDVSSDAAWEGRRRMMGFVCLHMYTHPCLCSRMTWKTHTQDGHLTLVCSSVFYP